MVGLGTMIYLVARALPRIGDELQETPTKIDRLFASIPLHKADAFLNNFLEKFLRKTKLFLMKLDNYVGGYLDQIKKINGNGKKNGEEKPTLFSNGNGHKEEDESGIDQTLHNTDKGEQV